METPEHPLSDKDLDAVAGGGINAPTPITSTCINPTTSIYTSGIGTSAIDSTQINPTVIGSPSITAPVIPGSSINPIVIP